MAGRRTGLTSEEDEEEEKLVLENLLCADRPVRCAFTANCIIIAPQRLKFRLSGSARKSQKRFRDTPRFKFQAVLARTQPFLSRSVEKRGDQSRFKCRQMVNYCAIRSKNTHSQTTFDTREQSTTHSPSESQSGHPIDLLRGSKQRQTRTVAEEEDEATQVDAHAQLSITCF